MFAFLYIPQIVTAQTARTPFWLLYEKGNALMEKKEYGEALQKFQEAIVSAGVFPEAEMAIGDIYRTEGEVDLAIRQYQKAYGLKKNFYIQDFQYKVLYKLSQTYVQQRMYKQMEDSLLTIVKDDINFNEPATSRLREQIESNYYKQGLDYILRFYIFNLYFSEQAHADLGWFYYRSGRFGLSALHLLYSICYKVSEAYHYAQQKDPTFQFTSLEAFVQLTQGDEGLLRFMIESGIYKDLYYLAGSVFAIGYPSHATSIWKILANSKEDAQYAELSKKQLKVPWIEPFLQMKDGNGTR
jgi:tetratricopeptide (TPR) repeat protein